MDMFSRLLSTLHIHSKLNSFFDDRLKANQLMTLSDYLEFQYTQLAQHSTESGISHEEYIPNKQLIVSLTSHGERTSDAYLAIETIMQGTVKPNRIILWLTDDKHVTSRYFDNQQARGLEIRYVKDFGPHTKLIPALNEFPNDVIITVDDDIFYKPDLVENLLRAYIEDPSSIHANRIALMTKDAKGRLQSYLKWIHYDFPEAFNPKHSVIIGVEGCLYPPHSLSEHVFDEDVLRVLCPTADDIWFTAMAMLKGTNISYLKGRYDRGFAGAVANLRMQRTGLIHQNENPNDCRNDIQIRAVFEKYNLYSLIG